MIKTALITGGSYGIGQSLATVFAMHGYELILIARREEPLKTVANELREKYGVKVVTHTHDLTNLETSRSLMDQILATHTIDALVNNAGFGDSGPLAKADILTTIGMINVNVAALTLLTQQVLPSMLKRGGGRILNVASTAAFQPGPKMAVYYATKAYVLSFSEAIAEEVRGSGVTVTALCPGPTKTGFAKRAHVLNSNLFSKDRMMTADEVARIGYDGLVSGKPVVIAGHINALGAIAARYLPRPSLYRVMRTFDTRE